MKHRKIKITEQRVRDIRGTVRKTTIGFIGVQKESTERIGQKKYLNK